MGEKERKPRKVKAKIIRSVIEIAMIYLDRDGCCDEYEECHEELDSEVVEVLEIMDIITIHD